MRLAVREYARAGFAAISIEDQTFPKRCAFAAKGGGVVPRAEAVARLQTAIDARDELREEGLDILIVGRTDARRLSDGNGLEEALWRCAAFEDVSADVVYFEGPEDAGEMKRLHDTLSDDTPTMLAQVGAHWFRVRAKP